MIGSVIGRSSAKKQPSALDFFIRFGVATLVLNQGESLKAQ